MVVDVGCPYMDNSIILADPPWPYYGDPNKMAAAGKHYDLMTVEEIHSMPVQQLAAKDAALFVWATSTSLPHAIEAYAQWGFHYRGVAFVWVKTRQDGGIISGQGVRPTFTKPTTEYLLCGSTCRTGRPLKLADEGMGQVVLAPTGRHSAKPEIFQDHIEALFENGADLNKAELFARRHRPGWTCSGLELTGMDYRLDIAGHSLIL